MQRDSVELCVVHGECGGGAGAIAAHLEPVLFDVVCDSAWDFAECVSDSDDFAADDSLGSRGDSRAVASSGWAGIFCDFVGSLFCGVVGVEVGGAQGER